MQNDFKDTESHSFVRAGCGAVLDEANSNTKPKEDDHE